MSYAFARRNQISGHTLLGGFFASRRIAMARFRAAFLGVLALSLVPLTAHAQTYAAPKTPWGDPDLQGIWSGDSAFGIPMQRPESFGTRAELNDKEYADKIARDERARSNALTAVGSFRNDNGWVTKSFRQTSLIIDPPNGRVPPLVSGVEKRRTPQGTYGNGPFNSPEDFTAYDRCLTLGVVGSMTPKIYGNGYRIVQAPGFVVLMAEMIHEARVIPTDGRPHIGDSIRSYMGDSRGHWEGNTLVVETTHFNGKLGSTGNPVYSSTELKVVERITRVEPDCAALGGDDQRSEDLYPAVHDLDPLHAAARIPGAALRVSRREPGDPAGPRRRARRRQGARGRREKRHHPPASPDSRRTHGRWPADS
jgi:hypothetical protein